MTLESEVSSAMSKTIQWLRTQQSSEGYWMGDWRGLTLMIYYGTALLQCGADPRSEVVQDICDQIEAHVKPDGGFAHCPESDTQPVATYLSRLFLRRCRPESPALRGADAALARIWHPEMPDMVLMRWVLDVEGRDELLDALKPPTRLVRRVAWRLGFRLISTQAPREQELPKAQIAPWGRRQIEGLATQAVTWPNPEDIEKQLEGRTVPGPLGLWWFTSIYALQLLSGDRPFAKDKERTGRFVEPYVDEHTYDDGSCFYIFYIPAILTYLRAKGRTEQEARMRRAFETISYKKGGWIGTTMIGTNIYDTAWTVQAMMECGVPKDDPAILKACEFLEESRIDEGVWTWAWQRSCGRRFRQGDTDDSGLALLALQAADSPYAKRRIADVTASFIGMQREDGGIGTFMSTAEWGRLNPHAPSNTSRSLCALVGLGVSRDHPTIQRGLAWIASRQLADGSWMDNWHLAPVYGTAFALEALVGLGKLTVEHPDVERAVAFVAARQNADGGWGFDFYGQRIHRSRVEHTAFAAFILIKFTAPSKRPVAAIERAMKWLVDAQRADGSWEANYVGNFSNVDGYANTMVSPSITLRAFAAYRAMVREESQGARMAS